MREQKRLLTGVGILAVVTGALLGGRGQGLAQQGAFHLYYVPSAAHAPGANGSAWRTDLAVVNTSTTEPADLILYFYDISNSVGIGAAATLPQGGTLEWSDVLVSLFKRGAGVSSRGTIHITSTTKLAVSSRTYNRASGTASYGQYYPALDDNHGIASGERGFLPQIKQNAAFRTNLGLLCLNDKAGTARISVFDSNGVLHGNSVDVEVPPYRWLQIDRILDAVGAGDMDVAYAVVEVVTPFSKIWAYASVIDNVSNDPMTIPVLQP
ncbi:MAG: hypothetical protein AB2L07_11545 [Thermoanaerobaculaceae bacterium]